MVTSYWNAVTRFSLEGGSNMRIAIAAALVAAVSTAGFAQTTEFYVVQDVKTKKCTIVDKRPTTTTEVTVVGDGVLRPGPKPLPA